MADTARTAEKVTGAGLGVRSWYRALSPPSCGRCVILAGTIWHTPDPFQRHPRCDCVNVPAGAHAGTHLADPEAYLGGLDDDQLARALGSKANAQAFRDGADPIQIIDAYRPSGGKRTRATRAIYTAQNKAGVPLLYGPSASAPGGYRSITAAERATTGGVRLKYTTEGTIKRGAARRAMRQAGISGNARLMPETIYQLAGNDPARARELLQAYGWIRPGSSTTRVARIDHAARRAGHAGQAAGRKVAQAARAGQAGQLDTATMATVVSAFGQATAREAGLIADDVARGERRTIEAAQKAKTQGGNTARTSGAGRSGGLGGGSGGGRGGTAGLAGEDPEKKPVLSEDDKRHILDGDPKNPNKGGHRWGTGRIEKTEFPADWDDDKIIAAVEETIQTGTPIVEGSYSVRVKTIDGVHVKVKWHEHNKTHEPVFSAAYPQHGRGVIINMPGGERRLVPTKSAYDAAKREIRNGKGKHRGR
ncbi:MAG: EndoU domain-containing protein [Bifidobacteriaceae bacterium]|nr:EndoU domain-containing protein [Bifidobacteriaceae bacterium]